MERADIAPRDLHGGSGRQRIAVRVPVLLAAPFELCRAEFVTDACFELAWRGHAGANYRIQVSDTLSSPAWQDVSATILADASMVSWRDWMPAVNADRFYRIWQVE